MINQHITSIIQHNRSSRINKTNFHSPTLLQSLAIHQDFCWSIGRLHDRWNSTVLLSAALSIMCNSLSFHPICCFRICTGESVGSSLISLPQQRQTELCLFLPSRERVHTLPIVCSETCSKKTASQTAAVHNTNPPMGFPYDSGKVLMESKHFENHRRLKCTLLLL